MQSEREREWIRYINRKSVRYDQIEYIDSRVIASPNTSSRLLALRHFVYCLALDAQRYVEGLNYLHRLGERSAISYLCSSIYHPEILGEASIEGTDITLSKEERNHLTTSHLLGEIVRNLYDAFELEFMPLTFPVEELRRHVALFASNEDLLNRFLLKLSDEKEEGVLKGILYQREIYNFLSRLKATFSTSPTPSSVEGKEGKEDKEGRQKWQNFTLLCLDKEETDWLRVLKDSNPFCLSLLPTRFVNKEQLEHIAGASGVSAEEKKWLQEVYYHLWQIEIQFGENRLREADLIRNIATKEPGLVAPPHINPDRIHTSILDIGAEKTLVWIIQENKEYIHSLLPSNGIKTTIINDVLPISLEPYYAFSTNVLHLIPASNNSDDFKYYILSDDDLIEDNDDSDKLLNPYTNTQINFDTCIYSSSRSQYNEEDKGDKEIYSVKSYLLVDLWSDIISRPLTL